MKKAFIYMILLASICLNCQCKCDTNTCLAEYLEENESQIEMLRRWEIYFEPEREYWHCKHWYSQDSLFAIVLVQVDKYNKITSCDINTLYSDSITSIQTAIKNVNTLYNIKRIYGYKCIGAHEVELFNDTLAYDFCISIGDDKTTAFIMHMKSYNETKDIIHLYKKWYLRNY